MNVLLIDDDAIYQFVSKKTLEATGNASNIQICSNGEEAIHYLESNLHNTAELPDVIFLDVNMPVMNGWEFLEAYQALKPNFPKDIHVFLVTSSMNDEDKEFSRRFNCVQDYIVKPLNREKISELLSHTVHV
ncbi:MAG: response regulator [Bacteroidetes bacterium]|nr:response regulator [Bacteroidota bacterium]